MKRVNSFNIAQRKRDALLAFLKAVITAGQGDEKVTALCKNQFSALVVAYNVMQDLAERHSLSLKTPEVETADTWRDVNLSKLRANIRTATKNPDLQIADAAKRLWRISQELGSVQNLQFDQETGALTTFCLDLKKYHAEDLETVGVSADVDSLQQANEDFIKILAERTKEEGSYVKGSPQAARQTAENAYRDFVMKLNTLVTDGHYADLAEFIDYLNALIDRQRVALKQGTRNPSEQPDPDPDVFPEDPEGGEEKPEENPEQKPEEKPEQKPEGGGNDSNDSNKPGDSNNPSNPSTPNNPTPDPDPDPDDDPGEGDGDDDAGFGR